MDSVNSRDELAPKVEAAIPAALDYLRTHSDVGIADLLRAKGIPYGIGSRVLERLALRGWVSFDGGRWLRLRVPDQAEAAPTLLAVLQELLAAHAAALAAGACCVEGGSVAARRLDQAVAAGQAAVRWSLEGGR